MFTGYELTKESRERLLKIFGNKYPDVICHHITFEFGVSKDTPAPLMPKEVYAYATVDSGDGVEGILVDVDNQRTRPDGKIFHITLSIDKSKGKKPVDTNKYTTDEKYITRIRGKIFIDVIPKNFYT